jgi:hypothetical protein
VLVRRLAAISETAPRAHLDFPEKRDDIDIPAASAASAADNRRE